MLKYLPKFNPAAFQPTLVWQAVKLWVAANGVWWASSVVGHVVVLSTVLLLLGKMATAPKEGDAPLFEARLDTEIPPPELDHFEVGETPLDPTELNTETLSLVDAPKIEAESSTPDMSETSGGGSLAGPSGGVGGLDQFAVSALGPGPLVKGTGLAASGTGRGPGSGGAGTGFGARGDKDSRKAMVGGYGGTKASERAVAAALNWFARHQNTDGGWSLDGFPLLCKGEPCSGGGKAPKADVGATAMALLPFLAAGQTNRSKGPYQATVAGGLNWLINHEKANGDLRAAATCTATAWQPSRSAKPTV